MGSLAGRFKTGRKHCSKCGCWRHLFDFQLDGDRLQSWCKTCQRLALRERKGYQPRRYDSCRRGHPWTLENTGRQAGGKRYCRACLRRRSRIRRQTPEDREYDRIRKEAKRREAGIPPRNFKSRSTPRHHSEVMSLDPKPFADWLDGLVEKYGQAEAARMTGLDASYIGGRVRKQSRVTLDQVDAAMTRCGEFLIDWYPAIYEEA